MNAKFINKSLTFTSRLGLLALTCLSIMNVAIAQDNPKAEAEAKKVYIPFKDESPLYAFKKGRPTQPLEIASIFHKKAGTEPDFKGWAEKNKNYTDALEIDKDAMFKRVYSEIVKKFLEIPEDSLLNVQPKVRLGDYSELQGIQIMSSLNEHTFFSYDANGENFAIIPKDIEKFHYIAMSPERHAEFKRKNGGNHVVRAELILKISHIDSERPYPLNDGVEHWLIAADIAEIRFWSMNSAESNLLWRYQAPWHVNAADKELLRLYDEGRSQ
jgi:hypothetical protein